MMVTAMLAWMTQWLRMDVEMYLDVTLGWHFNSTAFSNVQGKAV